MWAYRFCLIATVLVYGCDNNNGSNPPNDMGGTDGLAADLSVYDSGPTHNDAALDINVSADLADASSPVDGIPGDARRFVNYTMFQDSYANAVCMNLLQCKQLDASRLDACKELQKANFSMSLPVNNEVMSGALQLNDLQCADAIARRRCDGTDTVAVFGDYCGTLLLTPHVTPGQSCFFDSECIGGYCDHHPSDAGVVPDDGCQGGVCVSYRTPTSVDPTCPRGIECNPFTSYCNDSSICSPLQDNAQTCAEFSSFCKPGFYCKGSLYHADHTGTCAPLPASSGALGDTCDVVLNRTSVPACGPTLYCKHSPNDGGLIVGPGTCQTRHKLNDPCDPAEIATAGGGSSGGSPCEDGTSCYTVDGSAPTCRPLAGPGGPCAVDANCQQTLYCRSGDHTCQPLPVAGQACVAAGPGCIATEDCLPLTDAGAGNGVCVSIKNWGDTCLPGFDFNSGASQCFYFGYCQSNGSADVCQNSCPTN